MAGPQKGLQAQFKEMEREHHTAGGGGEVKKHRQQLAKLRKMNNIIRDELATETKLAAKNNSLSAAAKLASLREQKERYQAKIQTEKLRIQEMDKQIGLMKRDIVSQKKRLGGANASAEMHRSVQKQIKMLENRLDKALIRHNEETASNKQLRKTIDNLRKERVIYDKLYKKLQRELGQKKQQMAEIIEEAEEAYTGREEAQASIARLKTAAEDEQAAFIEEWQQLGDTVDSDRRHKRGFPASAQHREGLRGGEADAPDEEAHLRRQVARALWAIAYEKAKQEVAMNKVNVYEQAFDRIKKATGITEVEHLVDSFVEAENQNFSLFRYNDEMGREIEKLESEVQRIKEEKAAIIGGEVNNLESNRLRALKDLNDKLDRAKDKTAFFEAKHSASLEVIQELKPGVYQIFKQLGCDRTVTAEKEDLVNEGVTEGNLETYLTLIEERSIELLQRYARKKGAGFDQMVTRPFDSSAHGPVYDIVPPSIDDEDGVDHGHEEADADADRPLTRRELKDRATRVVNRKQG